MEGVRMELGLRILGCFDDPAQDGLNVIEGPAARACHISHEVAPAAAVKQAGKHWNAAAQFGTDAHAARDRVALLLRTALELAVENALLKLGKVVAREGVPDDDEA